MKFFTKKINALFVITVALLVLIASAYAIQRTNDTVEGTAIETIAHISTTGAWQAISIPSTIENLRHIAIQVHNGTASDYTHIDNVVEFQISKTGIDGDFFYASGITIAIGKESGEVICFIKAAVSQKIAILGLR